MIICIALFCSKNNGLIFKVEALPQELMQYIKCECNLLLYTISNVQCPHQADFFSANRRFVGARANIFGNTVNIALENLTNLWKYDLWCTLILDWYEI